MTMFRSIKRGICGKMSANIYRCGEHRWIVTVDNTRHKYSGGKAFTASTRDGALDQARSWARDLLGQMALRAIEDAARLSHPTPDNTETEQ